MILSYRSNHKHRSSGSTTITEFSFITDSTWTISSDETWVTFSQVSGTANPTIDILTTENIGDTRTADITITSGGYTKIVTLVQYSSSINLFASESTVNIGKDTGDQASFSLTSTDVNWTATCESTWIQLSQTSGVTNGEMTIVVTAR